MNTALLAFADAGYFIRALARELFELDSGESWQTTNADTREHYLALAVAATRMVVAEIGALNEIDDEEEDHD
jgi:hypothetical protein